MRLAPVVFMERPDGTYEVQYLDEVEGEYYPAGSLVCDRDAVAGSVQGWADLMLDDPAGIAWEVRSADWELLALGRFDGRG